MQSIEALRKLAVFDRERIEKVLHDLLDLRAGGRFEDIAQNCTSENVVLEVVGDPRFFVYAGRYEGREAVRDVIKRMDVDIEYLDYELLDLMIDQNQASMRRRVKVRHRGTGVVLAHEVWDIFHFEDGLIAYNAKFIDSHAYRRMQRGE